MPGQTARTCLEEIKMKKITRRSFITVCGAAAAAMALTACGGSASSTVASSAAESTASSAAESVAAGTQIDHGTVVEVTLVTSDSGMLGRY